MIQNRGSIDGFRQCPVHPVMNHRFSLPVCGVDNAGSSVHIPCILNCPTVKLLRNIQILFRCQLILRIGRQCPLCDQSRPLNSVPRSCPVRLERVIRTLFAALQISFPITGIMFRDPPMILLRPSGYMVNDPPCPDTILSSFVTSAAARKASTVCMLAFKPR